MAIKIDRIAHYLDRRHWKYLMQRENACILTGVRANHVEQFQILIALAENGAYLVLTAPGLLHVKDHVYKGVLFQTLLAISWEVKLLRWEYNPIDGEVRASIAVPLEDAQLSERQFNRCLSSLIEIVDGYAMPRLKAVLETGEDPGVKVLEEQLLLTLQEILPPGFLRVSEKMRGGEREHS